MNKVKAIEVLKSLVDSYVDHANITMKEEDDDIADALEMAIEALDVPDTNVGDMISRRVAIDLFPDDDLEYDTKGGYIAPHLARRMICELPFAQPEQHWIPCSERLPKEKQSVLVTDGSVIWVCYIISTDEGYKWEDSHGYWLDLDEWIAWMKLPELYREGDAE